MSSSLSSPLSLSFLLFYVPSFPTFLSYLSPLSLFRHLPFSFLPLCSIHLPSVPPLFCLSVCLSVCLTFCISLQLSMLSPSRPFLFLFHFFIFICFFIRVAVRPLFHQKKIVCPSCLSTPFLASLLYSRALSLLSLPTFPLACLVLPFSPLHPLQASPLQRRAGGADPGGAGSAARARPLSGGTWRDSLPRREGRDDVAAQWRKEAREDECGY